jgi:HEAT repeat protein
MRPCLVAFVFLLSLGIEAQAIDVATEKEIREEVTQAVTRLESRNSDARLAAIFTIQTWHDYAHDAIPALVHALNDENPEVRAAAAHSLELIGPRAVQAAPALTKKLRDIEPSVRAAGAFALARIGQDDIESLMPLQQAANDKSPRVSLAGAFALQRLFPRSSCAPSVCRQVAQRALPLLFSSLKEETGYESQRLSLAIGTIDPESGLSTVDRLIQLTSSSDSVVSGNAALALETLGSTVSTLVPAMVKGVLDGAEAGRILAIRKLGWLRIGTLESVNALRGGLRSKSVRIRAESASSLGRIGGKAKSSVPDLTRLLADPEKSPRVAAAYALLNISPLEFDKWFPFLQRSDPGLASEIRMRRSLMQL